MPSGHCGVFTSAEIAHVAKVSGLSQAQVKTVIKEHEGQSCCFPALHNPKQCDSDPHEDLVDYAKQYAAKLKHGSKHDGDDKAEKAKKAKPAAKPAAKSTPPPKPTSQSHAQSGSACSRAR